MTGNDNFFNLRDRSQGLARSLAAGMEARVFVGDQAMISVLEVGPHAQGTLHAHPEEQWGLLLEGSGVRQQGDDRIPVKAGDFWRTPGNVPHTFQAGPDGALIVDIFSPPREEYRRAGSGFGTQATPSRAAQSSSSS